MQLSRQISTVVLTKTLWSFCFFNRITVYFAKLEQILTIKKSSRFKKGESLSFLGKNLIQGNINDSCQHTILHYKCFAKFYSFMILKHQG